MTIRVDVNGWARAAQLARRCSIIAMGLRCGGIIASTAALIVQPADAQAWHRGPAALPQATSSILPTAPPPAPLPAGWNTWVSALGSAGYTVTQGAAYLVDGQACQLYIDVFGNCGGNNPVAPYFIVQLPVVAGQYLDPYYATDFATTTASGVPVSEFFRIADNEAVVVVVNMPPHGAYFGYQSTVFTRDITRYPASTGGAYASAIMPDPNRIPAFGSIGNAINNVTIERATGAKWGGGLFGAITASNANLDAALRKVMDQSTQLKSTQLISEPIGDFAYTGIGQTADEFYTMIRYALPEDQSAGDAWSTAPQNNIWVFRVTDNAAATAARYPTPTYTQKKAASEASLLAAQRELANLLLGYSQATLGYTSAISSMITTVGYGPGRNQTLKGLVGQNCIAAGVYCAGDDQDTASYRVQFLGPITGQQTVFTVGVDHTQFPAMNRANATYISVGIYDAPTLTGVAGVWQTNPAATGFASGTLTGSALTVLQDLGLYAKASSNLQAQLRYLYASAVSRQCPAAASWCVMIDDMQIPEADGVVLSERAYMRVGGTTGGNPDVMLTPMTVHPES